MIEIRYIAIFMIIAILCGGCQDAGSASLPPASVTPTRIPPTGTSVPTPEGITVSVPQGKPESIDGTISPGEWDDAVVERFTDGSELFLMHNEGYLYLGIRANTSEMIVGNVFINSGEEVRILHASAALGTAIYLNESDVWGQTQAFIWCCRDTSESESARDARLAFLQEDGWVATNSRIGRPNELEYQIKIGNEPLHLAVNYIRASDPNVKIPWPDELNDDCIKPTPGGLPEQLNFSLDEWALIGLEF
jgi:hypothetical protein